MLNVSVRLIFAMFMTVSGSKQKYGAPVLKQIMAPVLKKSGSKKNFPVDKVYTGYVQDFCRFYFDFGMILHEFEMILV